MPADDERMTIDERRKYLKRQWPRYWKADRAGRSQLLTELEAVTGLHRKSLIRLLHAPTLERRARTTKRPRQYGATVADLVRVVWESLDYVCAERLTPALGPMAQHLAQFGELTLTPDLERLLAQISRSTVQRLLERFRQDTPRLPRRGPEAANRIAKAIPMERLAWDLEQPGHFEVDLVHHCGTLAVGEYVHTLQLVDVATGWSERVAVRGRSQRAMAEGFRRILVRLPFAIQHLHPDNGSEFLNDHLVHFWGEQITGLTLSRSRPYRKNDNPRVEQKNDTLVRAYLGHERLETSVQCAALNALYDQMWVYYNLFQPVLHLVAKEVQEGRLRRKWDVAMTPYQRLLQTNVLTAERHAQLAACYAQTNPRKLRREIYQALAQLWDQDKTTSSAVAAPRTSPTDQSPQKEDVDTLIVPMTR